MVEALRRLAKWLRRVSLALLAVIGIVLVFMVVLLPLVPVVMLIESLPIHLVPVPVWLVFFALGAIGKWVAFRWGHYGLSEAFAIVAFLSLFVPMGVLFAVIHGHIWLELVAGVIAIGIVALLLGGPPRPQSTAESAADKR
jgi:hypothetical protein